MKNNYTESHKWLNYGLNYDTNLYKKGTYDHSLWLIEQEILSYIFKKYNISNSKTILDFACGTGRVSEFIEKLWFKNIFGFDVSEEMLKIAKTKLNNVQIENININSDNISIYEKKFDIITSFRFFLNAEHTLREQSFNSLYKLLNDDGILIFNIHWNKNSLRYFYVQMRYFYKKILSFLLRREEEIFTYRNQLSISEIKNYLNNAHYKIEEIISYSFLTKIIYIILPKKIFLFIEKIFFTNQTHFWTHLIFICKKNDI